MKIIAAVSENGCIGCSGKIPWHFSEDFKHFKSITMGHTIVMGRKTFESFNGLLPGRKHVVLSSTLANISNKQLMIVNTFDDVLKLKGDIYICGGSRLYKQALPIADMMIITHVPGKYEGDTFFPMWPINSQWQEFDYKKGKKQSGLIYKFYKRNIL